MLENNEILKNPEDLYHVARWAYSVGYPIISDAQYDILQRTLYGAEANAEQPSWSTEECPTELLEKYNLTYLLEDSSSVVTNEDKSASIASLNSEAEVMEHYRAFPHRKFVLSYKLDGWNTQARYTNGFLFNVHSRGRSSDPIDLNVFKNNFPDTLERKDSFRIYGETIVTKEDLRKLREITAGDYRYQRTAVRAAAVNAPHLGTFLAFNYDDPEGMDDQLEKYQTLEDMGFHVPRYFVCTGEEILETVRMMSETCDDNLPSDGVVASGLNNCLVQDVRAIRLYRWALKTFVSRVVGYEESYGRHNIAIKLLIDPVETGTGVQTRLDIDNCSRIMHLGLYPGSYVAFTRISDAVEKIDESLTVAINSSENPNTVALDYLHKQ